MRLTLRTLLAYLDDTLEPLEIKRIGQKVGESDFAQELIARLKQVTRRRRITTPPATGPNAFDPNVVAEYLDNELSAEQVAEVEKICLDSDVHLAEVASCHQVLTLVLGEPAHVPPTAKERMYALVRGREAIPFRKAAASAAGLAPTAADADADEMFLLGLPFYRRGSWLRWALPVAGVLLLVIAGVALWQSIAGSNVPTQPTQVAVVKPDDNADVKKPAETETKKPEPTDVKKPEPTDVKKPEPTEVKKPDNHEIKTPDNTPVKRPEASPTARQAPPSNEREEVGSYYFDPRSLPSILVAHKDEEGGWRRLKSGARVATHDELVSLPGYASEVRLDNGVRLLLRGHVREFSLDPMMNYLQESAVVLHRNKDVDCDVTFRRGRLYLSNHKDKGSALVRLRFEKQVWDVTLEEPGTEVVLDLLKRYREDIDYQHGEEPLATLYLLTLSGRVSLAVEVDHFPLSAPPGQSFVAWQNKGGGRVQPTRFQEPLLPLFKKVLPVDPKKNPDAEPMSRALDTLSLQMLHDKVPAVVLGEVLQKDVGPALMHQHMLAIYCLGAIDEVRKLVGILGDSDPGHGPDRNTAIFTLRRWLGRNAQQGPKLYDMQKHTGLLKSDREFTTAQAEAVFRMLHDFNAEERDNPVTYELLATYLLSDRVAIAELARWHLLQLSRHFGVKLPALDRFNAAIPKDAPDREAAAKEVRDKVNKGELPPRAPLPAGPAPGAPGPRPRPGPPPKGKI